MADDLHHHARVHAERQYRAGRGMPLSWRRGSQGDWLDVVTYQIHYSDGRAWTTLWCGQGVPVAVLDRRRT